MNRIIVEAAKHSEVYWAAGTDEEWAKSSVAILRGWIDNGWPYYEPDKPTQERPEMAITEEEIDELPEGAVRDLAMAEHKKQLQELSKYEAAWRNYHELLAEYEEAQRIVRENDTSFKEICHRKTGKVIRREPVAWVAIQRRAHYEYCGVSLEHVRRE